MRSRLATALAATGVLAALLASPLGSHGATLCPPAIPITFGPDTYVDETRAGGEPVIYRTACEALGRDRRLGDFFTNAIDSTGAMVISYSDTRKGGSVALSAFTRQVGGPSFLAAAPAPQPVAPPLPTTGKSTVEGQKTARRLPATGLDGRFFAVIGLATLFAAGAARRWLRRSAC